MLPQLAQGDANKIFVIPSEFDATALGGASAEARARSTVTSRRASRSRAAPARPAADAGLTRTRRR